MLALGEEKVREYIKTIGLYRNKAKNVIALSWMLIDEYGGEVPRTRAGAGVATRRRPQDRQCRAQHGFRRADDRGRYACFSHRQPHRAGARQRPLEVELALDEVMPAEFKLHAHHWLILHGRYVCVRASRAARCA